MVLPNRVVLILRKLSADKGLLDIYAKDLV